MPQRILVIDDDAAIRRIVRRSLELVGYEVAEAGDGASGVRMFMSQSADLVICDINMPERNGLETIIELRRLAPGLPILAISGGVSVYGLDYLPNAADFGADWTLKKPFGVTEVQGAVLSILTPESPPGPPPTWEKPVS